MKPAVKYAALFLAAGIVGYAGAALTAENYVTCQVNGIVTVCPDNARLKSGKTIAGTYVDASSLTSIPAAQLIGNVPAAAIPSTTVVAGSYPSTGQIMTATVGADGRVTAMGSTTNGSALTSVGTVTSGTWNATAIAVNKGGTNLTNYTTGDLLYASGSSAISKLNDVAAGSYLRSGGTSVAPLWSTVTLPNSATTGDILYASATNVYGNLSDVVTGSYLRSGGVGSSPSWSTITLPNSTTQGDLLYSSSANTVTSLADVATGNVLLSGGVGANPSYGKVNLTSHVTNVLPIANGGTNSNTALNNNQVIISSGGKLVEAGSCTSSQVMVGGTPPACGAVPAAALPSTGVSPILIGVAYAPNSLVDGADFGIDGVTTHAVVDWASFITPVAGIVNNCVAQSNADAPADASFGVNYQNGGDVNGGTWTGMNPTIPSGHKQSPTSAGPANIPAGARFYVGFNLSGGGTWTGHNGITVACMWRPS
jgi:hypothetical protein